MLYIGFCKLENEILKKVKNAQKWQVKIKIYSLHTPSYIPYEYVTGIISKQKLFINSFWTKILIHQIIETNCCINQTVKDNFPFYSLTTLSRFQFVQHSSPSTIMIERKCFSFRKCYLTMRNTPLNTNWSILLVKLNRK